MTDQPLIAFPDGWTFIGPYGCGGAFREPRLKLQVIVSVDDSGPECWLHVSVSREDRIPSYDELHLVKRLFIGDARDAVQYFPVRSEHVNMHPYCLHLWHCLTKKTLSSPTPRESV